MGLTQMAEAVVSPVGRGRPWPQSIAEFEELVDLYQHRLIQFAYCRLQDVADAEDVVQDVLVQAYRRRDQYRNVDNAEPLLFRMVANRATDLLRRRKFTAGPLEAAAAHSAAEEPADAARHQRWIESLLAHLPSRQAEVIRMRVYGDLPFDSIAAAIGCSVPTVKSRFRYGIQKLRKTLKRSGGGR
jgi:RNA polymerase sigma-70 factor, ECF subfamily